MSERRWWLVDLSEDGVPGHHLFEGATARSALAAFRASMTEFFVPAAGSRRMAREMVRVNRPVVCDGPFTDAEACAHETGWAWAWEMCRGRYTGSLMTHPVAPADRAIAVRILGEEKALRMERQVAESFGISAPVS